MGRLEYSSNTLTTAMSIAVVVHVILLAIPITQIELKPNKALKEVEVSFLEEPTLDEVQPDTVEPVAQTQAKEDLETPPTKPLNEKTINEKPKLQEDMVVAKPSTQSEPTVKVEATVTSTSFKAWLEHDTQTFTSSNPGALDKFDKTFSPEPIYTSPPELSPDNPQSRPARSTTFKVEKNGRRTCMARIINMLDVSAQDSFTAKDCTPPKKFELDMKKPNNGWMDR